MKVKSTDELSATLHILNEAKKYGLEVEIIHTALKLMKDDNNLSVIDALWNGRKKWIK